MFDFEVAAINVFRLAYPCAEIRGCYFHFCQCLWRNIQCKGISKLYINNAHVHFHLTLYKSIGFVPLECIDLAAEIIEESLNHLISTANLPEISIQGLIEYHNYFKQTWLNNPTYPRELWNHYNMTEDRTNNNNEGFNNFLQHFIQIAHPTLFHLINDLKVIETRVSAAYYNLKNGTSETTKRLPIYMARDRRITYLKKDLESTNISLKSYDSNIRTLHI